MCSPSTFWEVHFEFTKWLLKVTIGISVFLVGFACQKAMISFQYEKMVVHKILFSWSEEWANVPRILTDYTQESSLEIAKDITLLNSLAAFLWDHVSDEHRSPLISGIPCLWGAFKLCTMEFPISNYTWSEFFWTTTLLPGNVMKCRIL